MGSAGGAPRIETLVGAGDVALVGAGDGNATNVLLCVITQTHLHEKDINPP